MTVTVDVVRLTLAAMIYADTLWLRKFSSKSRLRDVTHFISAAVHVFSWVRRLPDKLGFGGDVTFEAGTPIAAAVGGGGSPRRGLVHEVHAAESSVVIQAHPRVLGAASPLAEIPGDSAVSGTPGPDISMISGVPGVLTHA